MHNIAVAPEVAPAESEHMIKRESERVGFLEQN